MEASAWATRRGLKALWCVAVAMAHRTANVSCLQKARNRRSLRRRVRDAPSASSQATAMVARLGLSNGSNESTPEQDAYDDGADDDDDFVATVLDPAGTSEPFPPGSRHHPRPTSLLSLSNSLNHLHASAAHLHVERLTPEPSLSGCSKSPS